jgi:hypothetical protein
LDVDCGGVGRAFSLFGCLASGETGFVGFGVLEARTRYLGGAFALGARDGEAGREGNDRGEDAACGIGLSGSRWDCARWDDRFGDLALCHGPGVDGLSEPPGTGDRLGSWRDSNCPCGTGYGNCGRIRH